MSDLYCHGCRLRVSAPVVGSACADLALLPPPPSCLIDIVTGADSAFLPTTGGARTGHNQPMCKHLQGEIQINYVIFEIKV